MKIKVKLLIWRNWMILRINQMIWKDSSIKLKNNDFFVNLYRFLVFEYYNFRLNINKNEI